MTQDMASVANNQILINQNTKTIKPDAKRQLAFLIKAITSISMLCILITIHKLMSHFNVQIVEVGKTLRNLCHAYLCEDL
jgi:hypothetical protein